MSFNTKIVAALTGLSRRQIDSWDRANVVKPSLKDATGCGGGRLYSFRDLVQLKVAKTLTDTGVSLQKSRAVILYLKRHFPDRAKPVAGLQFITDGVAAFVITNDDRVILNALAEGQMVFALALGKIIEDLNCRVNEICREHTFKVSIKRKAYEVVLHPDTEDGGYCAACPGLLGCDSQGDSVEEALEMIKDAIKGHLTVAAKKKKKRVVT